MFRRCVYVFFFLEHNFMFPILSLLFFVVSIICVICLCQVLSASGALEWNLVPYWTTFIPEYPFDVIHFCWILQWCLRLAKSFTCQQTKAKTVRRSCYQKYASAVECVFFDMSPCISEKSFPQCSWISFEAAPGQISGVISALVPASSGRARHVAYLRRAERMFCLCCFHGCVVRRLNHLC